MIAAAISEPRQDLTRPARRARTRRGLGLDGRKIFCTDVAGGDAPLHGRLRSPDEDGGERYGYAHVPADAAASDRTTTGTRSACAPRAAIP